MKDSRSTVRNGSLGRLSWAIATQVLLTLDHLSAATKKESGVENRLERLFAEIELGGLSTLLMHLLGIASQHHWPWPGLLHRE